MACLFALFKDEANHEQRVHISNYDVSIHHGKIFCMDGHAMIAKKGSKKLHHFAHAPNATIDTSNCKSNKGNWHVWWQARYPASCIEVQMRRPRADIVISCLSRQMVIEIQHSYISEEDIRSREAVYGPNLVWIFDG